MGGDAAAVVRRKPVSVDLFGETRAMGSIDTRVITDLLSIITAFKKAGGRHRLGPERVAAVDAELRAQSPHEGVEGLGATMRQWKEEYRARFDAANHYDERRAAAYTAWNAGSQQMLSRRCLELASLAPNSGCDSSFSLKSGRQRIRENKEAKRKAPGDPPAATAPTAPQAAPDAADSKPLVVDVGCGTGLSSEGALQLGYTVAGLDLAPAMLQGACTALQVKARSDLRQGIPLRSGCAAAVVSVGALHYLGVDAAACTTFMQHVSRVLQPDGVFVAQFFPPEAQQVALLQDAAAEVGLLASAFLDQPHRTNAKRWFFIARRPHGGAAISGEEKEKKKPKLCALYDYEAPCALSCSEFFAQHGPPCAPLPGAGDATHDMWLWKEHLRHAHKLVRTQRHAAATDASVLSEGDAAIATAVAALCGEGSVLESSPDVWEGLAHAMHNR